MLLASFALLRIACGTAALLSYLAPDAYYMLFLGCGCPRVHLMRSGPVLPPERVEEFLATKTGADKRRFFPLKKVTVVDFMPFGSDQRSKDLLVQFSRTGGQTDVKWPPGKRLSILAVGPDMYAVGDTVGDKSFARDGDALHLRVTIKRALVMAPSNLVLVPLAEVPLGTLEPGRYKVTIEWLVEPLDEFTQSLRLVQECQLDVVNK